MSSVVETKMDEPVSETFRRFLYGHEFTSFVELEEAIQRFTQETGYHFKPVNSHKFPAVHPNAVRFVFYSRKYVCVLSSTRKRVGCDAFFNIMHQKEGFLVVTSFRTEHNHGPVPVEPSCIKRNSQCSLLADVGSRHPSSPEMHEQTRILCSAFKTIMQERAFKSFDDLMSAVREYEKASNTKFKRKLSVKLHSNHPLIDILKYRYVYFVCCHAGVFQSCSQRTSSRSRKFGCMARFAAIDLGGELHVNALNLAHNHICSSKLVSAYAKKS
uniref:FAR1 domain-containing protein n=2 Tax=Schistocephalus solidus TaxID=70667 RepID=A0A0V0JAK5_SCHSO